MKLFALLAVAFAALVSADIEVLDDSTFDAAIATGETYFVKVRAATRGGSGVEWSRAGRVDPRQRGGVGGWSGGGGGEGGA